VNNSLSQHDGLQHRHAPFQHLPRTPPRRPPPQRCSATQRRPRQLGDLHRQHKAQHDQITKCGCRT